METIINDQDKGTCEKLPLKIILHKIFTYKMETRHPSNSTQIQKNEDFVPTIIPAT